MNDISIFLRNLNISYESSLEIAETITELIGNAIEHTKSDCLVDIDLTESYRKKSGGEEEFYGINIIVLNFSDILFGEFLKLKIKNEKLKLNNKYEGVKIAYTNHALKFDVKYKEEDFYKIASFQHEISGSDNKLLSGGKGLTNLIKSLASRSASTNCYLMSGCGILSFKHEFLKLNEENWIGFNEQNEFLKNIPASECIDYSKVYFPGTAYNLNFAMRKEDNYENK